MEKFESFVYGTASLEKQDDDLILIAEVEPWKNSRPFCSDCQRRDRQYDYLEQQ
jgi:hypothetical protein